MPVRKLDGDLDVFGDGSVTIISTPGHTPGHQSLLVHLPKTGWLILLSGDAAHFKDNWDNKRVPSMNVDARPDRGVDEAHRRYHGREEGRPVDQSRQAAKRYTAALAPILRLRRKVSARLRLKRSARASTLRPITRGLGGV